MINPKSRSLEWITEAAHKMGVRDNKLNKLKKTHPEAFFYWTEIQSMK